jgi:membrane protein YdbS with pleckstrin-like domain
MSWKRGIWFQTTGIVTYNRITILDVRQGPVRRAPEISMLAVRTAGYSGQAARRSALRVWSMQRSSVN